MDAQNELTIGGFGVSVILYVALGLIYKAAADKVQDRFKALIAVLLGIGLGLVGLAYIGDTWTAKNVIDYLLRGFMAGAGSVGLYELQRTAINPRG